jgi:hypothetical protein
MSPTTNHSHKGYDQPVQPPLDAREPAETTYAPPETEACFEEIER